LRGREAIPEALEKTDEPIDQIVYKLHGLTEDEVEVVEPEAGPLGE